MIRPDRRDEPARHGSLGPVRQWIESVALAAGIRHNQLAGTWDRSLVAYDH